METAPSFLPSFLSSLLPRNKQQYKTRRIPHSRVPQVGIRLHLAFLLWLFWALLAHQYSRCFALVLIPLFLWVTETLLVSSLRSFQAAGKEGWLHCESNLCSFCLYQSRNCPPTSCTSLMEDLHFTHYMWFLFAVFGSVCWPHCFERDVVCLTEVSHW